MAELLCELIYPMRLYGVATTEQIESLVGQMEGTTCLRLRWLIKVDFDHGFCVLTALSLLPGFWLVYCREGLICE